MWVWSFRTAFLGCKFPLIRGFLVIQHLPVLAKHPRIVLLPSRSPMESAAIEQILYKVI